MTQAFAIDPSLDRRALAPVFSRFGRLHIPGFLHNRGADDLIAALAGVDGWTVSTMGGGSTIDIPAKAFAGADEATRTALLAAAHGEARSGFHYMFESLRISDLVDAAAPVPAVLKGLYDWLNGEAFLAFAREISGFDDLVYVDAQATRYLPGHYLNQHDDARDGAGRRLAYVLNLTPRWRPDWGGLLAFVDRDGHVAEAYSPAFNALNLFRVPQPHLVSAVATFAGGPRLSITGWIRSTR